MTKGIKFSILLGIVAICISCNNSGGEYRVQTEFVPGFEKLPHNVAASFQNLEVSDDETSSVSIDIDYFFSTGIGISDLSENVRYVRLASDSLLGGIDDLFYQNNHWYVVDRLGSKAVYQFGEDGEFVNVIGNYGTGPGEYIDPTNVSVSDAGVYIHSEFQGVIYSYDLQGQYTGTQRIPFLFDDFHRYSNGLIFNTFNRENGHIQSIANSMVVLTDNDLDIQKSGVYYDPDLYSEVSMGFSKSLKEHQGQYYYLQPFSRTLTQIDPITNEQKTVLKIDFGSQNVTENLVKSRGSGPMLDRLMSRGHAVITDFLVNNHYYIFKVVYQNRLMNLYVKRDSFEVTGGAVVVDNFDQLSSINPSFLIENKLVSLIEPMALLKYGEDLKKNDESTYQRLFTGNGPLAGLDEMDNIVLRIHDLD